MDPSKTLFEYAKEGQFEKIESLLEKYPKLDVNASNNKWKPPLYWAARGGHAKTCEILVKLGANVNILNIYGETPIHGAACEGHDKTCEILVKLGANVNTFDNIGATPLHLAVYEGHDKTCEVLIKEGAEILINERSTITMNIIQNLSNKCKKLVVLYENGVDPRLGELRSKIKKRQEQKKKLLSIYFISDIVRFIGEF